MTEMTVRGNRALLDGEMIGFLAAGKIAPLSILPTLDWAQAIARQSDKVVVSGFSSSLERDVLDFLLKGTCGIVIVLARRMYKTIPPAWKPPLEEGRLLIVSTGNAARQTRVTAKARNRFVSEVCKEVVFPSPPLSSSSLLTIASHATEVRYLT